MQADLYSGCKMVVVAVMPQSLWDFLLLYVPSPVSWTSNKKQLSLTNKSIKPLEFLPKSVKIRQKVNFYGEGMAPFSAASSSGYGDTPPHT